MEKELYVKTCITRIPTEQGESIEEMVRRATENNEPISATAPMIYTEEADGVRPEYDIRTDRNELALEAIDKYQKSQIAKGTPQIKDEPKTTDVPKVDITE